MILSLNGLQRFAVVLTVCYCLQLSWQCVTVLTVCKCLASLICFNSLQLSILAIVMAMALLYRPLFDMSSLASAALEGFNG